MPLLNALKGCNKERPPIWLMRQAGRYLPEYQSLRAKHSLYDLFFSPKLAAEITKMPIERFGFDAAILFSDITVIVKALGFDLYFDEGPKITGNVQVVDMQVLGSIFETIKLLKQDLKVPLIGFCGGPFTVASYMPEKVDLALLTEVTIEYVRQQEKAGVDVIQIFDSWADRLNDREFEEYLPHLKKLINAIQVPVIFFMRNAYKRFSQLMALDIDAISFDSAMPLTQIRKQTTLTLQGNLDPEILFQPLSKIREAVEELMVSMRGDPGFIVNLGHGVKPGTPIEAVQCLVETVRLHYSEKE